MIAYVNYMAALVQTGDRRFQGRLCRHGRARRRQPALVDEVDILLGARLAAATKASIKAAVDAIPATATNAAATASTPRSC